MTSPSVCTGRLPSCPCSEGSIGVPVVSEREGATAPQVLLPGFPSSRNQPWGPASGLLRFYPPRVYWTHVAGRRPVPRDSRGSGAAARAGPRPPRTWPGLTRPELHCALCSQGLRRVSPSLGWFLLLLQPLPQGRLVQEASSEPPPLCLGAVSFQRARGAPRLSPRRAGRAG